MVAACGQLLGMRKRRTSMLGAFDLATVKAVVPLEIY
jgi:hypothetical protein